MLVRTLGPLSDAPFLIGLLRRSGDGVEIRAGNPPSPVLAEVLFIQLGHEVTQLAQRFVVLQSPDDGSRKGAQRSHIRIQCSFVHVRHTTTKSL